MIVGSLSVMLGLTQDKASWKSGEGKINHFRRLGGLLAGFYGAKFLGNAFLGFNKNVENAKNQIASMFALSKKTSVEGELENAGNLYDMLRKKAQQLPGSTEDYVKMLGLLAFPMSKAKLGLEDMRDITSSAFVTAKAMGDPWQVAARNIRDFIMFGALTKQNKYLIKILDPVGITPTKESRKKVQGMSIEERAGLIKKALLAPQNVQMQEQLSKSFEGRWDAITDTLKQLMGKIGAKLFSAVKVKLTQVADWLSKNEDKIEAWADKVGAAIGTAFGYLADAFSWLIDHQDILVSILVAIGAGLLAMAGSAIVAWLAVAWPIFAGAGLFFMFTKLFRLLGPLPTIFIAIGAAAVLMWLGIGGPMIIALLGFAVFAAAIYVWRDKVVAAFDWVGQKASSLWSIMNKIPGISNLIGAGKVVVGAVTGNGGLAKEGLGQSFLGPLSPGAWSPSRGDNSAANARGSDLSNITVNSAPNITINASDPAKAKEVFNDVNQKHLDAAARKAWLAAGGS